MSSDLDRSLNESVLMVGPVPLETSVYRPDGQGPFPVVVINHGKSLGLPKYQPRYRPLQAVRFFLARGYAVVVPMRQGFSRSGGSYRGDTCDLTANGRAHAEDVASVVGWLGTQPNWFDPSRILVMGHSHGGWTTLAYAANAGAGVRGLVNIAGGLKAEPCRWELEMVNGASAFATPNGPPSLWIYGENDSLFKPALVRQMVLVWQTRGAPVNFVSVGSFANDAHQVFDSDYGAGVWQPVLAGFLPTIGLPADIQLEYAHYLQRDQVDLPNTAPVVTVQDVDKVPFIDARGRAAYRSFLAQQIPRAFAIAPNGAWGWAIGGVQSARRALDTCDQSGRGACRLYAVNDQVVWEEQQGTPSAVGTPASAPLP